MCEWQSLSVRSVCLHNIIDNKDVMHAPSHAQLSIMGAFPKSVCILSMVG